MTLVIVHAMVDSEAPGFCFNPFGGDLRVHVGEQRPGVFARSGLALSSFLQATGHKARSGTVAQGLKYRKKGGEASALGPNGWRVSPRLHGVIEGHLAKARCALNCWSIHADTRLDRPGSMGCIHRDAQGKG